MFHVSRPLMPIGKGKNQAKLHQKRIKISIYLIYLSFFIWLALKTGLHFSDT